VATAGITIPAPAGDIAVGDDVVVQRMTTTGHTRCPRYVQGRRGIVVRMDKPASLPDLEAHSSDRRREPIACVRFDARELWGAGAEDAVVHVDLWTSYLEKA
jgi:nitrile hydratase